MIAVQDVDVRVRGQVAIKLGPVRIVKSVLGTIIAAQTPDVASIKHATIAANAVHTIIAAQTADVASIKHAMIAANAVHTIIAAQTPDVASIKHATIATDAPHIVSVVSTPDATNRETTTVKDVQILIVYAARNLLILTIPADPSVTV